MTHEELEAEQKKIILNALLAGIFCTAVLVAGYIILPLLFVFPTELTQRIAFAFKANLFVFVWVVLAVRMVSRVRFYSSEDNRGSAYTVPSEKITVPLAFLQNTLEQAVIAAAAYLGLATLLSGNALAVVPTAVLLFSIGRITFLRGYSKGAGGRAFGIVTTVLPTAAGYIWGMWLVISQLF